MVVPSGERHPAGLEEVELAAGLVDLDASDLLGISAADLLQLVPGKLHDPADIEHQAPQLQQSRAATPPGCWCSSWQSVLDATFAPGRRCHSPSNQ